MKNSFYITVFVLTMSAAAFAGKPAGSGNVPDIPVTSRIADYDSGGIPYSIQSDGQGSYLHGVNGDVSILMHNGYNRLAHGDWLLDLALIRTVSFTLNAANAVNPGDPGYVAPATLLGTFNDHSRQLVNCTGGLESILAMHTGNAIMCPMLIPFLDSPYRLNMEHTNWPETQEVQVYCNNENSGGCSEWFITPIPIINSDGSTSPGKTRARLEQFVTTNGKQGSWTNRGAFNLTFHIHVTRP